MKKLAFIGVFLLLALSLQTAHADSLPAGCRAGDTILEACTASQISKPTLYRRLRADYNFKTIFDEAIFHANNQIDTAKEKVQERNWEEMKKIALRKRD